MSNARKPQKQSAVKNMWCALSNQYNIQLEFMDQESMLHPDFLLRDLSGYLPPILLKRYDTLNHLHNTAIRLQAELDKQLITIREGNGRQTDYEKYRMKLQQLTMIQTEKLNLASLALSELRQCRNQIAIRHYTEDQKSKEEIPECVFTTKGQGSDVQLPFTYADLLLNLRAHAAAGLTGTSLVIPIKSQTEDLQNSKEIQQFKAEMARWNDEYCNDQKRFTILCGNSLLSPQISEFHKVVLSCLSGKIYVDKVPEITQEDAVLSAFAEAGILFEDIAAFPKHDLSEVLDGYPSDTGSNTAANQAVTTSKRGKNNQEQAPQLEEKFDSNQITQAKIQLVKNLQERFKTVSKNLEILINRSDLDDKQKGVRQPRQRMKIGQIIQNGCLPYFSHVEGVSGIGPSGSASISVDSSIDISREYNTPEQRDGNDAEHSLLLEDEEQEREAVDPAMHDDVLQSNLSQQAMHMTPGIGDRSYVGQTPQGRALNAQYNQQYHTYSQVNTPGYYGNASSQIHSHDVQSQLQQMQQEQQKQIQQNTQQAQMQLRQQRNNPTYGKRIPPRSQWNLHYCTLNCQFQSDEDQMVQCDSDKLCGYAKEGWFHYRCLGFEENEFQLFEGMDHFVCPGCWVAQGSSFADWGESIPVPKRRLNAIRRDLLQLWQQDYGVDLNQKRK